MSESDGYWGPEGFKKSYAKQYLYDMLPAPIQNAIVKASQHPVDSDDAEKHRHDAGYDRDTMRDVNEQ